MESTPQERLNTFINMVFKKKKKFSEYLNVHQSWASHYTGKGTSVIQSKQILDKLSKKGLNIEWYHTGTGEMLLESGVESDSEPTTNLDTPQGRLMYFINLCFASKSAFGKVAGIHRNEVARYTNDTAAVITKREIIDRVISVGLNFNWYLTGVGSMFADNEAGRNLAKQSGKHFFTIEDLSGGDIDRVIKNSEKRYSELSISKDYDTYFYICKEIPEKAAALLLQKDTKIEYMTNTINELREQLSKLITKSE